MSSTRRRWLRHRRSRGYTGQREIASLDLYNYNARYYDPYIGRFIQADTVIPDATDSQGFNRYSYVRNNPLKYNDPSGHCWGPVSCGTVIGVLVVAAVVTGVPALKVKISYHIQKNQLQPVYEASENDAQFISNMFTSDSVKGDTVRKRLRWILRGSSSCPQGYMRGDYGSSGFNDSVNDQVHFNGDNSEADWGEANSNQVIHFMTAVAWGRRDWLPPANIVDINLIIGHELTGDNHLFNQLVRLDALTPGRKLFMQAVNAFEAGEENWDASLYELRDLPGVPWTSKDRKGNSIEDLRLSVIGWQFGRMVRQGKFATRQEAADWLEKHLQ